MARPSLIRQKRAEMIPVVARAFAELGYRRMTTSELARRCGVRENILYRLWPDKRAMFIASIDYVYELSHTLWTRMAGEGGGRERARRLLEYEARHHGEFGLYRIVFAGLSETDDPDVRKALRRMYGLFQQFIAARIAEHRRGRGKGFVADEELAAWAIVGLGTLANIGRDLGLLSPGQRQRLIARVGRLLLDGRM